MAGSDEVNRNECKVPSPSLSPCSSPFTPSLLLGASFPCGRACVALPVLLLLPGSSARAAAARRCSAAPHLGAHLQLQAGLQHAPPRRRHLRPRPRRVTSTAASSPTPAPPTASPPSTTSSTSSIGLAVRIYRPAPPAPPTFLPTAPPRSPFRVLDFFAGAPSPDPFPVIIFFHGGSFAHSSSSTAIYDQLCRRLVKLSGGVVVSVDYRRAPEYRYPCAYDDGWAALKWVASQPSLRSGDDEPRPRLPLRGQLRRQHRAHHVAVRAADEGIRDQRQHPAQRHVRRRGARGVGATPRRQVLRHAAGQGLVLEGVPARGRRPGPPKLQPVRAQRTPTHGPALHQEPHHRLGPRPHLRPAARHTPRGSGRTATTSSSCTGRKATIGFYLLPNTDHYHEVMEEIADFIRTNVLI
ncbi:hypothetical protein PR202_gb01023 [Eleusine coracana subsp. coracana]|uniref:Alpha/beta hydrolase fold-3 domain-containing protein n=1 Tax=Eleusine coracana subsp. coracana TaxID=191504 RepID=A0AAV5DV93_ELECO|nr:hypothetical protein PR202_gb01023 [Eleusine coracana subsp. coracana]